MLQTTNQSDLFFSFTGGCCHTYIDKGYEFDVGIHYIGDVGYPTMFRVLLDQVTEGQLEWAPLEETFDYASIGYGADNRMYPIIAGELNSFSVR